MLNVDFIVASNNESVLRQNLLASPDLARVGTTRVVHDAKSSSTAYNEGVAATSGDYIAFVHQDVYLPKGFDQKLARALAEVEEIDPHWGVLSCFGRGTAKYGDVVGRVWSSGLGRAIGAPLAHPVQASAVDELLLVIRRSSGLQFDEKLPGFHCYAADLVQMAKEKGLKTYVGDMPVVHNSQPVRYLDGGYGAAYGFLQRKWRDRLPIDTLVVPVTPWGMPLWRARARLAWLRLVRKRAFGARRPDPAAVAVACGYVDISQPSSAATPTCG